MYKDDAILYRLAQRDALRRDLLAAVGKKIFKLLAKASVMKRKKSFPLYIQGQENIPEGAVIIVAAHTGRLDVEVFIQSVGRYVNPVVAIDADVRESDWLLLKLLDTTGTMRSGSTIAAKRRKEAKQEMRSKLLKGNPAIIWPEGTYCPIYNDMLGLFKGGCVELAQELDIPIVPLSSAWTWDVDGNITGCYVEFQKPFLCNEYSDSIQAVIALRELMLSEKRRMNAKHNPGKTQADFTVFRRRQAELSPIKNYDYFEGARFSLNYKFDPEGTEALFRNN